MIAKLSLLALAAALATSTASRSASFEIVYSFTGGSDGSNPTAGLVSDKNGNLYGTTVGNVFELPATGGEQTLYTFAGGKDANSPEARLLLRNQRVLGTTIFGGRHGAGTLFRVKVDGTEKVLHSFCSLTDCMDGQYPSASLVQDSDGDLYGTARYGGAHATQNHGGVIFRIRPGQSETVLYSFCAQANCTDGNDAANSIMRDTTGNLYGTTVGGGVDDPNCVDGCGTIYRLAPDGTLSVLYSFCSQANCADGFSPGGGPIMDSSGNLYGSASFGGATGCQVGCGLIYKLAPDGTYTVLHTFEGGKHGQWPLGELTIDTKGNLYGATGGDTGAIFEITASGTEKTLHAFCQTDCSDGRSPTGTLLPLNGFLYGTTFDGGLLGRGVVFRVKAD